MSLILILVLVALGVFVAKPKFLDSRTKEADHSAEASKKVEGAVAEAIAAEDAKGAAVAASLNQIGVAANQLPTTPQSIFISREVSFVSPLLPPPNPLKLLEAERRRSALLEGRLDEADRMYTAGVASNTKLLERATNAEAKAAVAFDTRRDMDKQLAESAALARGQQQMIAIISVIAALAVGLWLYVHFTSFGTADIARLVNRVNTGMNPIDAIDATIPDWMHSKIKTTAAVFRAKEAALDAAVKSV